MELVNRIKLFIYENKKKILAISVLVIVFMLSLTLLIVKSLDKKSKSEENILLYEPLEEEKSEDQEEQEKTEKEYYFVDIKGYVNSPGVYSLEKGMRIVDAINKAGGLKENANTSLLNLSREIFDEMVIVVYSESEINEYQKIEEKVSETKEICTQIIQNDACVKESDLNSETPNNNKEESQEEQFDANLKDDNQKENNSSDASSSEKININTATKEELMTLSKIGEAKALAIIEYRTKIGLFKTIEEIKEVSGIGDSLFESIKDYITV